jgi:hypothetical protein
MRIGIPSSSGHENSQGVYRGFHAESDRRPDGGPDRLGGGPSSRLRNHDLPRLLLVLESLEQEIHYGLGGVDG